MPVTIVVGGQYGSEGKGKVAHYLAREMEASFAVRCGGPNSGHTVIDEQGNARIFQQLPTAAILPDVKLAICAGSYIDLDILYREINETNVDADRLLIDRDAVVITPELKAREANSGLIDRISSTGSGTGAAVAARVNREKTLCFAKDIHELKPFLSPVPEVLRSTLNQNERIIIEGTQGFGLSPLHASRRRNDGLARIFHDLKLMEKEGSGFDLLYDRLLSSGRPAPVLIEGTDSVHITIGRRIIRPQVILLIEEADRQFQLSQRERITLGILAQAEGLTARELTQRLEIERVEETKFWLGRLLSLDLVQSTGRTQGTRYFLNPDLLNDAGIDLATTLTRIEPHRLEALIIEDLHRHPGSRIGAIHKRIGTEIKRSQLKRTLGKLTTNKDIIMDGIRGGACYYLPGQPK